MLQWKLYYLLSYLIRQTFGISCVDVHEKGSGASFKIEELTTLSSLMPDDLKKCTALLGKEQLTTNQSYAIWNSFVEVYDGAENIPEDQLQQLGWTIGGIPPAHFYNLSLTDIDTIASFGRHTELTNDQLESLKNAISDQWLGKDMEDLTSYDLSALRQILCAYNSTSIQMIHPDAYKDAAPDLALLTKCSYEVLKELAALATNEQAFGNARGWTSVQAGSVGCIMAGLPSISDVPAEAFEGITADIIDCMPSEAFQAMTISQISKLTPSSATALSKKSSVLNDEKRYVLEQAKTHESAPKNSIADVGVTQKIMFIALLCALFVV